MFTIRCRTLGSRQITLDKLKECPRLQCHQYLSHYQHCILANPKDPPCLLTQGLVIQGSEGAHLLVQHPLHQQVYRDQQWLREQHHHLLQVCQVQQCLRDQRSLHRQIPQDQVCLQACLTVHPRDIPQWGKILKLEGLYQEEEDCTLLR